MTRCSDIASPKATLEILEKFDIKPTKALGQNFLVNDAIIGKIVDLAEVGEGDSILEVGPGIGTLTNALLKRASMVTSIEKDQKLPEVLKFTLGAWQDKFNLIEKDALDLSVTDLVNPLPTKLVSNLPYAVAATIILDYFQRFSNIEEATVMVQKEVAQRIAAKPGNKNYGAYTVKLSMFALPVDSFDVSRNDFMPKPHVDSTVIKLKRNRGLFDVATEDIIRNACIMADAAFASRRKTLANSCKTYFASRGQDGAKVASKLSALFEAAGVDGQVRGETLTTQDYLRLGKALLDLR